MAEQKKQSPEPEFEGTPEEFIETLQKRIQNSIPIQSLPLVKIIKFHEKGTKPEIKIENLAEFICEKTVTDIKQAMVNSVLYVDIHNAPIQALTDVITTMAQGARPLAKVGIIDVLSVNIDECPEGSLNEPLELRKTRISEAFTEILSSATVSSVEQETGEEEDDMSQGNLDKILDVMNRRFTILENHINRTKDEVKSEITRTKDQVKGEFESKVNNVRDELRDNITSLQNATKNEFETVNEKIDILLGNNPPKPEAK